MRYDHPADNQVEQEHGIDCQGSPWGRITVTQELHRGKRAPDKSSQDNDAPTVDKFCKIFVNMDDNLYLTITRAKFCSARRTTMQRIRERTRGRRQYPRTQTDWKKEMDPPEK